MKHTSAKRLGALPSANGLLTRLAYARAKAGGIDLSPLLREANLTSRQIEDPALRLRARDQIKFLNLVAASLQDDLLGLHLVESTNLREFGFLYYVPSSSDTLSNAQQRLARYISIANESATLEYLEGKQTRLNFRYVGVSRHLDRHQIEFFVTFLLRLCRELTSVPLMPTRVKFAHRPQGDCSTLVKFCGGSVEFGAAVDEVRFAGNVKDTPVVSADYHLNKLLVAHCEEALVRRHRSRGSFRSEVENTIVPMLPHGKADLPEVALRLGLSQRTLARRLSSERLTFSGVLEALKVDLAKRYLADKALSISEIAWLLGYQEVSSFTHAFTRWTGKNPRLARSKASS